MIFPALFMCVPMSDIGASDKFHRGPILNGIKFFPTLCGFLVAGCHVASAQGVLIKCLRFLREC